MIAGEIGDRWRSVVRGRRSVVREGDSGDTHPNSEAGDRDEELDFITNSDRVVRESGVRRRLTNQVSLLLCEAALVRRRRIPERGLPASSGRRLTKEGFRRLATKHEMGRETGTDGDGDDDGDQPWLMSRAAVTPVAKAKRRAAARKR